jgi:hypothetical protein
MVNALSVLEGNLCFFLLRSFVLFIVSSFVLINIFTGLQVLTDFQENPKSAQEHMKNPMVMGKIQKLVNAGIVQVR